MGGSSNFLALARGSTREQFALAWTCPFLVHGGVDNEADFDFRMVAEASSQPGALQGGRLGAAGGPAPRGRVALIPGSLPAGAVTTGPLPPAGAEGAAPPGGGAQPLVKSPRDPDASRISIGRSRRNDVILLSPQVSKLHAHLVVAAGGWSLSDVGSSNGTFVNRRRLARGEPAPIALGDTLRFGVLDTRFVDGGGLHDWLLAGGRGPAGGGA